MSDSAIILLEHASLSTRFQQALQDHIPQSIAKPLTKHNISADIVIQTSPSHTLILIKNLPSFYTIPSRTLRGPFEHEGAQALNDFLASHNTSQDQAFQKSLPQGLCWFINTPSTQTPLWPLLAQTISTCLLNTPFHKRMYWSQDKVLWARPLLSYQALFQSQNQKLPLPSYIECKPLLTSSAIDLAKEIESALNITICPKKRLEETKLHIKKLCEQHHITPAYSEQTLLEETTNTSRPSVALTPLPEIAHELPPFVLQHVIQNKAKALLFKNKDQAFSHFATIVDKKHNTNILENTLKGFTSVISAYLEDAIFFMRKDVSQPLQSYTDHLKTRLIHQQLGSVFEHISRLDHLANTFFPQEKELPQALALMKCDLETLMVHEYPDLQGLAGSLYAQKQNLEPNVCLAIAHHYKPLGPTDGLPESRLGALCALIDKVGTISNFCSIGYRPTSSKDPLGFRRIILGIIRIVQSFQLDINLQEMFLSCLQKLLDKKEFALNDELAFIEEFTHNRFLTFMNNNHNPSIVLAVTKHPSFQNLNIFQTTQKIEALSQHPDLTSLTQGFKRALTFAAPNIQTNTSVSDPPSQDISTALNSTHYDLTALTNLAQHIHKFCDNHMVKSEQDDINTHRQILFFKCLEAFNSFAHFESLL